MCLHVPARVCVCCVRAGGGRHRTLKCVLCGVACMTFSCAAPMVGGNAESLLLKRRHKALKGFLGEKGHAGAFPSSSSNVLEAVYLAKCDPNGARPFIGPEFIS